MDMYSILLARYLGAGGGGTTNYDALSDKPQINWHTLQGDDSTSDIGLGTASTTLGASPVYIPPHST